MFFLSELEKPLAFTLPSPLHSLSRRILGTAVQTKLTNTNLVARSRPSKHCKLHTINACQLSI